MTTNFWFSFRERLTPPLPQPAAPPSPQPAPTSRRASCLPRVPPIPFPASPSSSSTPPPDSSSGRRGAPFSRNVSPVSWQLTFFIVTALKSVQVCMQVQCGWVCMSFILRLCTPTRFLYLYKSIYFSIYFMYKYSIWQLTFFIVMVPVLWPVTCDNWPTHSIKYLTFHCWIYTIEYSAIDLTFYHTNKKLDTFLIYF
jgi:hypothetical protein